jgi:transcription elongation factor GreA
MIWVWKAAGAGELIDREGGPDPERLLLDFLSITERSLRGTENKLGNRLKSALASKNYATTRFLLETLGERAARRVKDSLVRFPGLTDQMRTHVSDLLAETHPQIYVEHVPAWEEEGVIWSTKSGLERKKEEYGKLVNEKLPAVAEAIGRAASFGDLSENAEYTAALEERERLTERANSLKAELDQATVLPEDAADGDEVTVGSTVRVRNAATGEEREYTFLGPWDVRVEEGVYSYRAPLSLAFMGKAVGDEVEVTLDDETLTFEILEVRSALR